MKKQILLILMMLTVFGGISVAKPKDRPYPDRKGFNEHIDFLSGVNYETRYNNFISSIYCKDCWVEVWSDNIYDRHPLGIEVFLKTEEGWQSTYSLPAYTTTGVNGVIVAKGVTCGSHTNCFVKIVAEKTFVFITFYTQQGNVLKGIQVDWVIQQRRTYTPSR